MTALESVTHSPCEQSRHSVLMRLARTQTAGEDRLHEGFFKENVNVIRIPASIAVLALTVSFCASESQYPVEAPTPATAWNLAESVPLRAIDPVAPTAPARLEIVIKAPSEMGMLESSVTDRVLTHVGYGVL